jgi:hypothetical protein
MARSRQSRANQPTELSELQSAVDRLTEYVHVLTIAVDELTREIQWRNRQVDDFDQPDPPRRVVLTSMPIDPAAEDWELNRVTADDLPLDEANIPARAQQSLFH